MLKLQTVTLTKPDENPRPSAKRRPAAALLISITLHLFAVSTLLLIPRPALPSQDVPTAPQFSLQFSSEEDLLTPLPTAPPETETQTPPRRLPQILPPIPIAIVAKTSTALPLLTISATFAASEKADSLLELPSTSMDFPQAQKASNENSNSKKSQASSAPPRLAAARPAKRRAPIYPKLARKKGYQGTSVFIATINPDGSIKDLKLSKTSGHAILDRAAKEALRHWKFTPAKRNGITIASQLRIPIIFRLG